MQGPKETVFAMTHYDGDVFTYVTESESATGTTGVSFTRGSDGRAARVLVENLDVNGEGSFRRK